MMRFLEENNILHVEEVDRLSNMEAGKIMESFEQVKKILKECNEFDEELEMEDRKVIYEHECFEAADFEEMNGCKLIDIEDCWTEDGEEAIMFTFKKDKNKYINLSFLNGMLYMSQPYMRSEKLKD